MLAVIPPTLPQPKRVQRFDGLFEQPSVVDWGFVAAVAWFAYRAGQSSAVRKKTPNPTLGAVLSGYVGLRAMDKLFGVGK